MPAPTPPYVKNMIRRSLREIIEPSPKKKEISLIWEFFNHECAYCGKQLNKEKKEGHIDHLISASLRGSNHISNRVLSCADCNEKEKLDMDWEKFLIQKNRCNTLLLKRKGKILKWQEKYKKVILNKKIIDKIESLGNEVSFFYDEKVKEIRNLKQNP